MKNRPFRNIVLPFLVRNKALTTGSLVSRAIWELAPMQIPIIVGLLVDALSGRSGTLYGLAIPDTDPVQIATWSGVGLATVAVAHAASAYTYAKFSGMLNQRFVADLRRQLAERAMSLPLSEHGRRGAGEMLDRVLQDTSRLRGFVDKLFVRTTSNVLRIGYPICMLVVISLPLAGVVMAPVALLWLLMLVLQQHTHAVAKEQLDSKASLTTTAKESFDHIETVQSHQAERQRLESFGTAASQVENLERRMHHLNGLMRASTWVLTGLGYAVVWGLGARLVANGSMTIGTLIVFAGFTEFAYRPFRYFPRIAKTYQKGRASLDRVCELQREPIRAADISSGQTLIPDSQSAASLRVENVDFSYGEQPVLHSLNLEIEPRQFTVIVGRSGCGKSTLLRLLCGLHAPTSGQIVLDERCLDGKSPDWLRSQVVLAPQEPALFSGRVRENLLLGSPHATAAEIEDACQLAGAAGFINDLPDGTETQLGRGGVQLSIGQKQRLALARILLRKPRVLLLDEPTSALDAESQAAIYRTLRLLSRRLTVVCVAHRVETFQVADRLLVLEEGTLVDSGTHEELLLRCDDYNDLVNAEYLADVDA